MTRVEITIRPSFGAEVSYDVRPQGERHYIVRRDGLAWPSARREQVQREGTFDPASPDDPSAERTVTSPALADVLAQLTALRVAAAPSSSSIGLDGTTYTITIEEGWASATYTWWQEAPPEWAPLAQLMARIVTLVNGALDGEKPDPHRVAAS